MEGNDGRKNESIFKMLRGLGTCFYLPWAELYRSTAKHGATRGPGGMGGRSSWGPIPNKGYGVHVRSDGGDIPVSLTHGAGLAETEAFEGKSVHRT